jgi:hypothetical protein
MASKLGVHGHRCVPAWEWRAQQSENRPVAHLSRINGGAEEMRDAAPVSTMSEIARLYDWMAERAANFRSLSTGSTATVP